MKSELLSGLLLALAALAAGQNSATALPAQPLGPDDLISLTVANLPEMTHAFRIDPEGLLRLPFIPEPVNVRRKLPSEVEQEIRGALREQRILLEPVVSLSVLEYASRPVTVVGAVRRPTTFQATPQTTLLEAIARAEGFAPEAGPAVFVSRPNRKTGEPEIVSVPAKQLLEKPDPSLNFRLYGGEQVRVPDALRVWVLGNVKRPAAIPIKEPSEATILRVLTQTEGLAQYASSEAVVYRGFGDDRKEIVLDLKGILKGRVPDYRLEPQDVLYIPESNGKRLTAQVLNAMFGFGISTISGLLVFQR